MSLLFVDSGQHPYNGDIFTKTLRVSNETFFSEHLGKEPKSIKKSHFKFKVVSFFVVPFLHGKPTVKMSKKFMYSNPERNLCYSVFLDIFLDICSQSFWVCLAIGNHTDELLPAPITQPTTYDRTNWGRHSNLTAGCRGEKEDTFSSSFFHEEVRIMYSTLPPRQP